ncbi:MAG: RNA chaperone Hfq [Methylophilaceae bacterium]|nr:RNA chaperone Hfq [Methylophilaceae bacterium]
MTVEVGAVQGAFLNTLYREGMSVSVYLINGVRLKGKVHSFDQEVILLENEEAMVQLVYRHAIATIVPSAALGFELDIDLG